MTEALMIVQLLTAAVNAGLNMMPLLQKVSDLIKKRQAAGETITADDLRAMFDDGDALEKAARNQFEATLADPNTPAA
jgi:hypothetical protein